MKAINYINTQHPQIEKYSKAQIAEIMERFAKKKAKFEADNFIKNVISSYE